ncbi:hypothetical protein PEX1_001830 [Penicillium expansum]|uniref:AB hydrolase-1 domain-containing protein n=1 Tax=Penicillium expansum TaxID=27334 RepID=A0A0A2J307_PENEN|nr:hypothetical protein PEX2_018590 [Penicillium expansum]KGO46780.1 hypothetical protein PEXP_064700 [Penicillium expansum]KGO55275.1 hypothetical protein PEX1_001830 [Penicillium expansum]KGO62452.1 hypothetical protein PEX2_018590 [Penicillium expansum]
MSAPGITHTETSFKLYEGEQQKVITGHPVVYKYIAGDNDPSKPLVTFVPGMAHNGRISYGGHEGYRSEDFLAHWFHDNGYGFLGISYPLDSEPPLMPATSPAFTIPNWGVQAAETIKAVIEEHHLPQSVVILAWSMAGKVLQPVTVEAGRLGIDVKLFVSLAATPALPGSIPAEWTKHLDQTDSGYLNLPFLKKVFLQQIDEQEKINHLEGRRLIEPVIYEKDYFGATPIGITTFGFRFDNETKQFVREENKWQLLEDGQAQNFGSLPAMAAIYPTSGLDFRHAITDKATWSYLMIQRAMAMFNEDNRVKQLSQVKDAVSAHKLAAERSSFQDLQKVVLGIPELMTADTLGNHFFFCGESGARRTVETVIGFLSSSIVVQQNLEDMLDACSREATAPYSNTS